MIHVRDERMYATTALLPIQTWGFVALCAAAGALAVPVNAVAAPASALVAGLVGLLGLRTWRWSRLPSSIKTEAPHGIWRVVRPAASWGIGLIVGLMLLGVIRLVIEPAVPVAGTRIAAAAALPLWRRVAIIYVAAVGEELVFRLFLLSFIAGLTIQGPSGSPTGCLRSRLLRLIFPPGVP